MAGAWWLEVAGCSDWHGMAEPNARICSSLAVCLTIDQDCRIHGSTIGQYDQETCVFTSPTGCMEYQLTCPDNSVSVSGKLVADTLWVSVDASQPFEREVLITETSITGAVQGPRSFPHMQSGYGSALRNGERYLCQINARDGGHVDVTGVDAAVPGFLSYSFTCDLRAACLETPEPSATGPAPRRDACNHAASLPVADTI